jgi:hypothetical protein
MVLAALSNQSLVNSPVPGGLPLLQIAIILVAYGTMIWPAGWMISRLIGPMRRHQTATEKKEFVSIEKAGHYIGYCERLLILTFVLLGEYTAIGFLVTAKSILRFEATRVEGEYILIGTLVSFTVAILVGVVVNILV